MTRRRWFLAFALALVASPLVAGVLGSFRGGGSGPVAFVSDRLGPDVADAFIRRRTISPEVDTGLPIRTDGRHVSMTGPMACDPGENWEVSANLTQPGSRGQGRSEGVCRGDIQEWVVRVAAEGGATFEPGAARGCAVLRTLKSSAETDRHEWCNDIKLIAAGTATDGQDGDSAVSWLALAVGGLAVVVALVALVRPRRVS